MGSSKKLKAVFCIFYCPSTNRFLLELRSRDVNNGGTYGLFGGGIDKGESALKAIKREIYEETGYLAKNFDQYIEVSDGRVAIFGKKVKREFAPNLSWESAGYIWTSVFKSPMHKHVKKNLKSLEGLLLSMGHTNG